jgi:hypothetical protein
MIPSVTANSPKNTRNGTTRRDFCVDLSVGSRRSSLSMPSNVVRSQCVPRKEPPKGLLGPHDRCRDYFASNLCRTKA